MDEILDLTPGLQCCLRCGRVLTDRALHDALEEPVLASLRASRPGAANPDAACQPCLEEYRNLLSDRQTRSAQPRRTEQGRKPFWMVRWFERRLDASQA